MWYYIVRCYVYVEHKNMRVHACASRAMCVCSARRCTYVRCMFVTRARVQNFIAHTHIIAYYISEIVCSNAMYVDMATHLLASTSYISCRYVCYST
jgi:hypothetical protein